MQHTYLGPLYNANEAVRATLLTHRVIDSWVRSGVVAPTMGPGCAIYPSGRGHDRLWSRDALVWLYVLGLLRKLGLSKQELKGVKRKMSSTLKLSVVPFVEVTVDIDGAKLYVTERLREIGVMRRRGRPKKPKGT